LQAWREWEAYNDDSQTGLTAITAEIAVFDSFVNTCKHRTILILGSDSGKMFLNPETKRIEEAQ
jgi:hypothetical protein